jgi:hypothetical protein
MSLPESRRLEIPEFNSTFREIVGNLIDRTNGVRYSDPLEDVCVLAGMNGLNEDELSAAQELIELIRLLAR